MSAARLGRFPRSRERGPVEATRAPLVVGRARGFPRSRGRGPVEANPARYAVRLPQPAFRAHVSAAPLKLLGHPHAESRLGRFPRSRERGPVEAGQKSFGAGGTDFLSALT